MSKKSILLALSVACAAMFAVPAVASAGQWHLTGGHQNFTTHTNTVTKLTTNQGEVTECTSSSGSGTVNAAGNAGTISLIFHGCKESAGNTNCTTSGQTTGTIIASGDWESVYLTHDKTTPGIKIYGTNGTERNGHLSTFKCAFGLVTIKVEGSVLGDIEQKCGTKSKHFTVDFTSKEPGFQTYTQNTTTGAVTDLTVYRNGNPRTGSQDGTGHITLEKEAELNCT